MYEKSSTCRWEVRLLRAEASVLLLLQLPNFLSSHDLLRLRHYAKQLADLPLILDLLPVISTLFFNERLPPLDGLQLSHLQQAVLLATGAQKKTRESPRLLPVGSLLSGCSPPPHDPHCQPW